MPALGIGSGSAPWPQCRDAKALYFIMFTPTYRITNGILKKISSIEAAREIIINAPLIPAWERQFRENAVVRSVHHSTHIEGNPLTFTQTEKILEGRSREFSIKRRDMQEVINYRNVMKYIETYQNSGSVNDGPPSERDGVITEGVVKQVHRLTVGKIVRPDQEGSYRTVQTVSIDSRSGEVSFRHPRPEEVPVQMKEFLFWLNKDDRDQPQAVLKAGIIQAEITRIHPFTEGNGRTARALATLFLYLNSYDIKRFFSLDEYYDQDAEAYFAAIQTYQDRDNDLTRWLEYFTEGLAVELSSVKEKILKLSRDHVLKEKIGQIALNERQEKILQFVERKGRIANRDWRKLLHLVSDDTILRDVKDLIKKKVLKKEGKTKAAYYVLR